MTVQDTIDTWWAAFEGGDVEKLRSLMTDDVEITMPDLAVHGRDAVLGMLAAYKAAFPDLRHEVASAFESGDRAVSELRVTGTNTGGMTTPEGSLPPTGDSFDLRSADVMTVRDGKIASWHTYLDTARLAAVIGAAPGPDALPAARALAERVRDTVERGDLDAFVDCFAVDAVLEHPMLGRIVGRDAIRQAEAPLFTAFTDVKLEIRSVSVGTGGWATVEFGGSAVNTGALHLPDGTEVPPTGRSMSLPMVGVIRIDDEGRMAEHRRYLDTAILARTLGLAPEPATAGV